MTLYRTRPELVEAFQFCTQPDHFTALIGSLDALGMAPALAYRGFGRQPDLRITVAQRDDGEPIRADVEFHHWIVLRADRVTIVSPDAFDRMFELPPEKE